MGKFLAFVSGAAAGVLGYIFVKSDLGKECITIVADKCRPLTEEGKEWVDSTIKKVTDKFPSGGDETTFSYTYTSGTPEEPTE
ncbi:MAG: hypothetical protein FWG40_08880 [Peptococcaceae bacterium]|nr:hypothetical protein [Peptococcaceae bacterium]